jgi:peroxiredoxin
MRRAELGAEPYDDAMSESLKAPVGSLAPDFTLPRSGGGEITLSGYRGRPIVLAFLRGYA